MDDITGRRSRLRREGSERELLLTFSAGVNDVGEKVELGVPRLP